MIEEKEMVCIICPKGCKIKVYRNMDITGNKCKKGAEYAMAECAGTMRTLTTVVSVAGGQYRMVPVKSDKPLPKGLLMECMMVIGKHVEYAPVNIGDKVIEDILGTGVNIIATSNIAGGKSHVNGC